MPHRPFSSILVVGSFDGVHLGHQALVAEAVRLRDKLGAKRVVALAFDPSPRMVLRPGSEPARLTTFDRRAGYLKACGADEVVKLVPTPELLGMEPEAFITELHERYTAAGMIEGEDFRFGKGRRGDLTMLRALGVAKGIAVLTVPPVETAGLDQQIVTVSSTRIRALLGAGRVGDAAVLLGRRYELGGTVVRGQQRGRTIGFPTANVEPEAADQCLPADGVYAAEAVLADGRVFPAALNIGTRPTVGGTSRTIEPHLIGAPREAGGGPAIQGLPEYGWTVTLRFAAFLREQVRFAGLDALKEQLGRDVKRAGEMLSVGAGGAGGAGLGEAKVRSAGGVGAGANL